MISPRIALVYTPLPGSTFKAIVSRSARRSDEASLRRFKANDQEKIDYYELIYNQLVSNSLQTALSMFYAEHELINFSASTFTSRPIGEVKFYGSELELIHQTKRWSNRASIAYAKLRDLDLINPNATNSISAQPNGFGHNFAEVPNWIIKFNSRYRWNDRLEMYSSFVSHLGVKGRRDLYAGLRDREVIPEIDRGAVLFNLGANYRYSNRLELQLNAHNILGWFDRNLNNRFFRGTPTFRPDVPSFSISVRYALSG